LMGSGRKTTANTKGTNDSDAAIAKIERRCVSLYAAAHMTPTGEINVSTMTGQIRTRP